MTSKHPKLTHGRKQRLQEALIRWYRQNRRDLPWRREPLPYRVWIAEMMAQQTRIDTLLPYYHAFMQRFPDIHSLAAASEQEVLAAWSGLGYYRRARHLHRTAQIVVTEYKGLLPSDPELLQGLPGIGRYSAGAIASVAFNVAAPILDGNVTRVLARIFDLDQDVSLPESKALLWSLAEQLLPKQDVSDFNQALMELGALGCTPRNPNCHDCPARRLCRARQQGNVDRRPVRARPKAAKTQAVVAIVAKRSTDNRVLLVQHPERGLFSGLWSVPTWPAPWSMDGAKSHAPKDSLLEKELGQLLGLTLQLGNHQHAFSHVLSHLRLMVQVRDVRLETARPTLPLNGYRAFRFVRKAQDLSDLGISTLTRRILKEESPAQVKE